MANNTYATLDNFFAFVDRRTALELSGDDGTHTGQPNTIQVLLDMQASELDSYLYGRYGRASPVLTGTIPAVITKWVCATTARRLFGRRTDIPKQIEADGKWADDWLTMLMDNKIGLPGIPRAVQPVLQDSDFTDGRSRWDQVYGQLPSQTGPSGGK